MNIEIKFRARDKDRKEFLSAGQILLAINSKRYPKSTDFYLDVYDEKYKNVWRDRFEIQQFIGLFDKNAIEIYEGDIVRQFADCTESGKSLYFFYTIEWDKEYCAFVGREIHSDEVYLMPDLQDIEVIGNVYENSDLPKEVENE